jgi:hypothetical protein
MNASQIIAKALLDPATPGKVFKDEETLDNFIRGVMRANKIRNEFIYPDDYEFCDCKERGIVRCDCEQLIRMGR